MAAKKWDIVEEKELSECTLQGLLNNDFPAIRIKSFASKEECERLVDGLLKCSKFKVVTESVKSGEISIVPSQRLSNEDTEKDTNVVRRIGMSQSEFAVEDKEKYFVEARAVNKIIQQSFSISAFDVFERYLSMLRKCNHGNEVSLAAEPDGRKYFVGLVRWANNGIETHFDFAPFHAGQGWMIADVRSQLSWNLYLTQPSGGGETIVYDRQWDAGLEELRSFDLSRPYDPNIIDGVRTWTLQPIQGDLVLFNSRNFHKVLPAAESPTRYTFGSFMGRFESGEIVLWS
ncbi:uncharacterized protein LOC144440878 isoform X2 [Glandiceps talaboti]